MIDTYNISTERASRVVTETFSNSFSSAITLLDASIRQDVYNIYGLVRLADEVVDSYQGTEAERILTGLENEVYEVLESGFSANVLVHAFCRTAVKYDIKPALIAPFFASMKMDITRKTFTSTEYHDYIYGSAEVIGLMCLNVFVDGDRNAYSQLEKGAQALGAAYQKVNFLRDISDDYHTRDRFYFPETSYETFDEQAKSGVVEDIKSDFQAASEALFQMPKSARFATKLSYDYYMSLLTKLDQMTVAELKSTRASVSRWAKLRYLLRARIGQYAN